MNSFLYSINWDIASGIADWIGVVLTSILTFIIITQTQKLSKQQGELDRKLNEQQIEIQKRQIKLDVFPYKRDIYINLYKIIQFAKKTVSLTKDFLKIDAPVDIILMTSNGLYNDLKSIFSNSYETVLSLHEAKYILRAELSVKVLEISKEFEEVYNDLSRTNSQYSRELPKDVKEYLASMFWFTLQTIESIKSKEDIIENLRNELNIAELYK